MVTGAGLPCIGTPQLLNTVGNVDIMLIIPRETEELARLLAVRSGTTPEEVVREAVEQRALSFGLAADRQARPVDMARIDAITRRSASRPLRDRRARKEILDEAWGDPK
jgi:antitoxin VapB